jgi:O-methyltransferase
VRDTDLEQLKQALCFSFDDPDWEPEQGIGHPKTALSMIGLRRMQNLRDIAELVLKENIPGDFCECGVWRGGAAIFMRGILKAYQSERKVWVCDSFRGMPYGEDPRDPDWRHLTLLEVPFDQVIENFRRFGLWNGERVKIMPGWFKDTLPGPIEQLALLLLDCDFYSSTMEVLNALYPKVSSGGYVIIDDYYAIESCRLAVDEYRTQHQVGALLWQPDWSSIYWRKP